MAETIVLKGAQAETIAREMQSNYRTFDLSLAGNLLKDSPQKQRLAH